MGAAVGGGDGDGRASAHNRTVGVSQRLGHIEPRTSDPPYGYLILLGRGAKTEGVVRHPPLAGRGGEIAALRQSIRDATTGSASTLLVSGEAGIGKTALLRQAEAEPVRLFRAAVPSTSLASPLLPLRQMYGFGGTDPLADFDAWLDRQAARGPGSARRRPPLGRREHPRRADLRPRGPSGPAARGVVTLRAGDGEDRLLRWLADVRRLPGFRNCPWPGSIGRALTS